MSTKNKKTTKPPIGRSLKVAGLFAGIGGIELGLASAGHQAEILCEIDTAAATVLRERFPDIRIHDDVTTLKSAKGVDLISAGFPCQDISLAGTRAGLNGERSGLISEVFRLAEKHKTEFLLLENVQHLLRLSRGANMHIILNELERMKYRWAYRVVDSRGFGLPQRRRRVIFLASRGDIDPADVLFSMHQQPEFDDSISELKDDHSYGFYWTEGKRGVGWAEDSVPTIKGGSGLGIPSPPAVFVTNEGTAGTPSISDAERLQGFESGWTDVLIDGRPAKPGQRWKMVGNAVSVPVAEWIGHQLSDLSGTVDRSLFSSLNEKRAWPIAAYGDGQTRQAVAVSTHVKVERHVPITEFLNDPLKPLSEKALRGYIHRARTGTKTFPAGFIEALERQADSSSR
jgi:DNA (cytosine-5)-methyltransferase 1